MMMPGRKYEPVSGYRYGFNGKEKDKDIAADNYDFGARIYDGRIARFLSVDRFETKFAEISTYIFAGNRPISAVDLKGDSLYILFYVGTYKGDDATGNEMFEASALTRQHDIENSSGFNSNRDKVVVLNVSDMSKIKDQVEETTKTYSKQYGKTVEFGIWSHAALEGPKGSTTTTEDAVDGKQMSLEGWGKINFNWANNGEKCRAGFYGCRTGVQETKIVNEPGPGENYGANEVAGSSFTDKISKLINFKNVSTLGQISYSFPSQFTNKRFNSQNGKDNFINSRVKNENGTVTINYQLTYLVGGVRRRDDLGWDDQHLAFRMRESKNGTTVNKHFQVGKTK